MRGNSLVKAGLLAFGLLSIWSSARAIEACRFSQPVSLRRVRSRAMPANRATRLKSLSTRVVAARATAPVRINTIACGRRPRHGRELLVVGLQDGSQHLAKFQFR